MSLPLRQTDQSMERDATLRDDGNKPESTARLLVFAMQHSIHVSTEESSGLP